MPNNGGNHVAEGDELPYGPPDVRAASNHREVSTPVHNHLVQNLRAKEALLLFNGTATEGGREGERGRHARHQLCRKE